jgi:Flp pilus assembly protein CpaB
MRSASKRVGVGVRGRFGTAHLIAAIAGITAALLLLSWTRSQEQVLSVVVAADEIRVGSRVGAGNLKLIEIPASTSIATSIVRGAELDTLVGQVATRSILIDEPILRTDLRPAATSTGLRAMSISLPPSNAVGGDLAVGDLVDVLVVGDDTSRFVAEQVPVLDLPAQVTTGLVTPASTWWVTLGVEGAEALEIADGVERGTIYLLRSNGTSALNVRQLDVDPDHTAEAGG